MFKLIDEPYGSEQWSDFYHLYDHVYLPFRQFETKHGDSIFIKNDFIPYFFRFFKFTSPVYLATSQGDVAPENFFDKETLLKILDSPFILNWAMDNCTIEHPKIIQGCITYKSFGYDCDSDREMRKWVQKNKERWLRKKKIDKVFAYFSLKWNKEEREELTNLFPDVNQYDRNLTFQEYLEEMSNYKYTLCTLGNLNHRNVWEALLVGSIPILRVPKETLSRYENYPYVCLPGKCKVPIGFNNENIKEFQSIFKINKLDIPK